MFEKLRTEIREDVEEMKAGCSEESRIEFLLTKILVEMKVQNAFYSRSQADAIKKQKETQARIEKAVETIPPEIRAFVSPFLQS